MGLSFVVTGEMGGVAATDIDGRRSMATNYLLGSFTQ